MNSKPKSIDMGSLIQKVTKRARELLKKKSKPQNKGKTANGTSRYSKSKRQKLLIGGVKVKIGDGEKKESLQQMLRLIEDGYFMDVGHLFLMKRRPM
jgi:hypothetical protein